MKKLVNAAILCLALSFSLYSQPAWAGRSILEDGNLHVPRIDVFGFGAMELNFKLQLDNEYLFVFVLESAIETSLSVENAGVFDPIALTIDVDEIELESGEVYFARLELLQRSDAIAFRVAEAELLAAAPDSEEEGSDGQMLGAADYAAQCADCHGADGLGDQVPVPLTGNMPRADLIDLITQTMPVAAPAECSGQCAEDVADYILATFVASDDGAAAGADDESGTGAEWSDTFIEAVFLAQTHVLTPDDPLFKLVGNRSALLKVQVLDPATVAAPEVTVELRLNGESETLNLEGPDTLPSSFEAALGRVFHQYDDSFTVMIPAAWVQPGLRIEVKAADHSVSHDILVGAPTVVKMKMFDVHYFGQGDADYPEGTFDELEAKWPVADLLLERVRDISFEELVIPARPDVNAPTVRVSSRDEYQLKTGLNFDGEQAAALEWVHALSAAGGNQDTAMCYVNIIGVPAGGQAGGFDGVGSPGVGILHHELGHALSLPHWGNSGSYPYKGDMHGIPAPDTLNGTHVGPTWAFDLPSQSFIPPTVQQDSDRGVAGTYKASPMQGGGFGDQEAPFLMRHFSDFSVNKMQSYLESKVAVERGGDWFKWDQASGSYSQQMNSGLGVRYPTEADVQVISVMAATTLADLDVNMAYPPIGPYEGNLILRFDPAVAADRSRADAEYCPNDGCDFSLRVTQGGEIATYMLAASGDSNDDIFAKASLTTAAINLPAANGAVTRIELLLTPDAEKVGLVEEAQVLDIWAADGDDTVAQDDSDQGSEGSGTPGDRVVDSALLCRNDSAGPVKVFILAGQSNMVGHGTVYASVDKLERNGGQGTLEHLVDRDADTYGHLRHADGDWVQREDVTIANISSVGPLSVGWGSNQDHIGPELQFGHAMGEQFDNHVLIIKTSWGGKSLAEDFRPPSSGGETGAFYTAMLDRVGEVLAKLDELVPGYQGQGYELVGFGWHQGWNDRINQGFNDEYQANMVNFINDLRAELDAPRLPFVLATTGMSGWEETHPRALSLMEAQLATPNDARLDEGNVAAVETRDFYLAADISPADQGYHWNRNAETYFHIGQGLADSMQPLICQ